MTHDVLSRRSWLRGGSALFGGALVSIPLGAVAFLLIARALSVADLGRYSLVVAAASLAVTLGTFRLETHLLIGLGGVARPKEVGARFRLAVRAALLVTVPLLVVGGFAAWLFSSASVPLAVYLLAGAEVIISPLLFGRVVLQMRGQQSRIAMATLAGRVVWLVWVLVLGLATMTITALVVGRVVAVMVEAALLLSWARLDPRPGRYSSRLLEERAAVRSSVPLAISGIAGLTYHRSDQFVVASIRGAAANGVYASAARLSELVRVVSAVIQNVVAPALVTLVAEKREAEFIRAARDALLMFLVPTAFVAATGFAGAPLLVVRLLGPEFEPSVPVFRALLLAEVAVAYGTAVGQVIIAHDDRAALVKATTFGALLNIAMTVPLVVVMGPLGAAIASAAAYALAAVVALVLGRVSPSVRRSLIGPAAKVAVCLGAALATTLSPLSAYVEVAVSGAAFVGSVFLLFQTEVARAIRVLRP